MFIFDLDGTLANCEHRRHFKPDWKAFYEACIHDTPIQPVINHWDIQIGLGMMNVDKIWSGRCESVREQTEKWLRENLLCFFPCQLKMRPIGDNTPDNELKERWLDEAIANGHDIEYVFDDSPKVVRMYRRRGIFVFDCNQSGEEF